MTLERFEHLELLTQVGEKGSEGIRLSQAAPFFANSDPDMPAVPTPAALVHDWLHKSILLALEHISERLSAKDNGPSSVSDQDVAMTDACICSSKASSSARSPYFIEGAAKSSYVKHTSDLKAGSVKVVNCHDSVIYILAPLKYATSYGCSDATVVLDAVGKVAPYNTFYSQLEDHMKQVGVAAAVNKWDDPLTLGVVDPHDSLTHPAGVSDAQAESASRLEPDQLTNFLIPSCFWGDGGSTKDNPFSLPEAYNLSKQRNHDNLTEVKQMLKEAPLEDNKKREVSNALHTYFKDWLYSIVMSLHSLLILSL